MATRKKSAFQTVTSHLGRLTRMELEELQKAVAALLEVTVEEEVKVKPTNEELMRLSFREAREGKKPKKGYVETKRINGYGPYLYLRFWSEGTLKSLYIGKKEDYVLE